MQIIVLGHRGMLGQMATRYFAARGHEIGVVDERFTFTADCPALARLRDFGPGLVLNCVGRIKHKDADRQALFDVNAVLPLQICERMAPGQFLVHPSTDCVFSGKRAEGRYRIDDPSDAHDDYGWSKRLGEVALEQKARAAILRVSIIGPDWVDPEARGLLGWFLRQPAGSTVQGYENHWWNGITTLEWCRLAEQLFVTPPAERRPTGMFQPGTAEIVSKYDMLVMFQEAFGTNFRVVRHQTAESLNRALVPTIVCPPLKDQVKQLVDFIQAGCLPSLPGGGRDCTGTVSSMVEYD